MLKVKILFLMYVSFPHKLLHMKNYWSILINKIAPFLNMLPKITAVCGSVFRPYQKLVKYFIFPLNY